MHVVYFDQRLGALLFKHWSKYPFSMFFASLRKILIQMSKMRQKENNFGLFQNAGRLVTIP